MKMRIRRQGLGAIFVFFLLMLLTPKSAVAEDEPYTGLDIVILVDQSGSMGGSEFGSLEHPDANDALDLRFLATQLVARWMGDVRLEEGIQANLDFRMAVVYFGDYADIVLPVTRIASTSQENWKPQLDEMLEPLQSSLLLESAHPNYGFTNFLAAFQSTQTVFNQMKNEDDSRRLKVIILLTDGEPCVVEPGAEVCGSIRAHMQEVIAYANEAFPYPEYQIFIVAMNDSRPYWNWAERYWNVVSHDNGEPPLDEAKLVDSNLTMGAQFQLILIELAEQLGLMGDEPIECGVVPVLPYLDLVRFTVHKPLLDKHVEIYVNDSQNPLSPDDEHVRWIGYDSPIEYIYVYDPEPGFWQIVCPTGVEVDPELFKREVSVQVSVGSGAGRFYQYVPFDMEAQLLNHYGGSLRDYQDSKYRLGMTMEVRGGDEVEMVDLLRDFNREGIYQGLFLPLNEGQRTLYLLGRTFDPNGDELLILNNEADSITIEPTIPVFQPPSMPATHLMPVRLVVRLENKNGRDVPVPENSDYQLLLVATLQGESGAPISVSLERQVDGSYTGNFIPDQVADYTMRLDGKVSYPAGAVTAFSQQIATLPVLPIQATLQEPEAAATQLVPAKLVVKLMDNSDQALPITEDLDHQPHLSLVLQEFDERPVSVPLDWQEDGSFTGDFIPETAADYTVQLSGTVALLDGAAGSFEKAIGTLTVAPVQATWEGFTGPQQQYTPVRIAYRLTDKAGRPLKDTLAPGFNIRIEVTVQAGGAVTTVYLLEEETGVWGVEYTPMEAQIHRLHLLVKAVETTGREVVLVDRDETSFVVDPTTLVKYAIINPQDGSSLEWRNWWGRSNPFVVEVMLQDAEGKPLDSTEVVDGSAIQFFDLKVKGPSGADLSAAFTLQPTARVGVYRATSESETCHNLGLYTIEARPSVQLKPAHVFDQPSRQARVEVVENHFLALILPRIPLMKIGAIVIVVAIALYQVYLRLWTAEGTLQILNANGFVLDTFCLKDFRKHTLKFRRRNLDERTGLKLLKIRQPLEGFDGIKPRPARHILVTARRTDGVRMLSNEIVTGGQKPLGKGNYLRYSRIGKASGINQTFPSGSGINWPG
ncbi:MAG: VWA domain-containing protein [Anaerolineales bacterium]|nr:VWA domain-containing protein [Anaerolineales bacterium]